jgi:soluble lytic murein transglycosylase-like protein
MIRWIVVTILVLASIASGAESREQSEYYAAAYADHYGVPLDFVRALIAQESGWRPCALSVKGARGLMQLMPATAAYFHVRNACDAEENISAGVRHLAHLSRRFHGDWRLVAAAYFAGEGAIGACELSCSDPEVVSYVAAIRRRVGHDSHRNVSLPDRGDQ